MNIVKPFILLLASFLLASCAPSSPPVTPRLLNVYVTSAAYARVSDLYSCAPASIVISLSDSASAELTLRLGEPVPLLAPAYQVGSEDILVVNHPDAGVGQLDLEQVQQLFSGRISNWKDVGGHDLPVQVWGFSADEDVEQLFDQMVMHGEPITSLARLAVSDQAMSDAVGNTAGSIGILPRHWKSANTHEALNAGTVPVLMIARAEPQGAVKDLIGCLQAQEH